MYTELYEAFLSKGYTEDTASRLAEIISDYDAQTIADVINEVYGY